MSYEVFAFEGNIPAEAPISWGAGAISDGSKVWNRGSGRECTVEAAEGLIQAGHLTRLPNRIAVPSVHHAKPLVVALVRLDAKFTDFLLADTGRVGGLAAHHRASGYQTYVFADVPAFDVYANGVIDGLLNRILFAEDDDETRTGLIRLGLTLNSGHPFLLATWVHFDEQGTLTETLARANLPDERRVTQFEQALSSFRRIDSNYELVYEGGVAEGGGLSLDVATNTFGHLRYVHRHLTPTLGKEFPFLDDHFGSPHFQEMLAASAHITFSSGPKSKPLGERLARIIELQALEAALTGHAPDSVRANANFERAIRSLVSPSPETKVLQRSVLSDQTHVIDYRDGPFADSGPPEGMLVLGFLDGIKDSAQHIGVRVGSKAIWVSAIDNGRGEVPEGANVVRQGNAFLYRPATFLLERQVRGERVVFHLLKMAFLDAGAEATLSAIPSSIVEGAFLADLELDVKVPREGDLTIASVGTLTGLSAVTVGAAANWLRDFMKQARVLELAASQHASSRWLVPPRPPKPTALARVLIVLADLGFEAPVPDVVQAINTRFDANVRTNNTRREVLNNPEFLEFTGDDSKEIRATEAGRKFVEVYQKAGGSLGRDDAP